MKINFASPVRDLNGTPFMDGDKPLTLGAISVAALLQNYQDEPNLPGEEKYQRYDLATRTTGNADITVEEIAKLKKMIGKFFGAAVVGPSYDLLEGRERSSSASTPATAPAPAAAAPAKKTRKKALEAVPSVSDTSEATAQ